MAMLVTVAEAGEIVAPVERLAAKTAL